MAPKTSCIGQCKALYDFTPEQDDELTLKEGKGQFKCSPEQMFKRNLMRIILLLHRRSYTHLHKGRQWMVVWRTSWEDGSFPINIRQGAAHVM